MKIKTGRLSWAHNPQIGNRPPTFLGHKMPSGRGMSGVPFRTGKNSLHTKQTFGCSHHTRYPQTELYRISCCSIEKTTGQTKIADSFLNLNVTCTKIGWLCLLTVGATKCCFKCIKIRVKAVGRFGSLGSALRHACIPILCIYVNICV